ncbi:AAA-domain-containing protein [Rhizoclosmatium globosum]|uniref:AAA-domain-containing protein n=1 Tax=Rhizoclosmatium globosum TaxID=329046 RepID=A0A1Y2D243_9FUNG|nr:AAA-domain-containing protein [Rhizoclosmatium globosum]|eukprot:ORY53186.1 AAA-domain-containing protein [Rhizoclosmatium globosum]
MKSQSDRLIILAATNRPNAIDPALRRPGRFDREIAIDAPANRLDIGNVDASIDFNALAIATNGYVGADLMALCREAVMHCLEAGDGNTVSNADFVYGLSVTTPSTTRGYAVGVPSGLTWDSVGGLEDVKLKLQQCVEWPITRRETFLRLGLKPPRGVLLYGPPGCSKTTLVKIIACTSNATFLSINGASLYSPFVGDSEQSVRALFHRARLSAPSVIFLDEIDAIVGSRDLSGGGGGTRDATQESVLSTLLNEMDGIEVAKDVLVVGATNRPDMIDAALMRPGRFDKILYVPPPDLDARLKILHLYSKGMPLSPSIDFGSIAERTERYTGADLESVCREAAFAALRERKDEAGVVEACHFEDALISVKPSLSLDMLKQYAGFSGKFGKGTRR